MPPINGAPKKTGTGWGVLLRALWHIKSTFAAGELQDAGESGGLWHQGPGSRVVTCTMPQYIWPHFSNCLMQNNDK